VKGGCEGGGKRKRGKEEREDQDEPEKKNGLQC